MKISINPGKFVAAVSGGVDSMVMLHLLRESPGIDLVVAHFDHGIRTDSMADASFVRGAAEGMGLPFVTAKGNMGIAASEAEARAKRYAFLYEVLQSTGSAAIITAHHQDDVLETVILNILRGTNRHGLSSLRTTDTIIRPMLSLPKSEIMKIAHRYRLEWREDSTNASTVYKRNYIRHKLLSRFNDEQRMQLYKYATNSQAVNDEADQIVSALLGSMHTVELLKRTDMLSRKQFIMLPHTISREVMAAWLLAADVGEIDTKMLERLVHGAKTFAPGRRVPVAAKRFLCIEKYNLALSTTER